MKRRALTTTLLASLLAASTGAGFAADAAGPQACQADVRQHCAGERPGGGRVLGCLQRHEAELSAPCRAALPMLQRCAQEAKSVCSDAGRRGMRECLRSHADQLSPE